MTAVLITIDWFLPAYKAGGPVMSISNMINAYDKDIRFKILCSDEDLNNELLHNIVKDVWVPFNNNTEVFYCSTKNRTFRSLKKIIDSANADVIFINGIYSLHFNFLPAIFSKAKRKIISVRGMLHPGAVSQKSFKKKAYIFLLKALSVHKNCSFHASDADEKKYIQQVFGNMVDIYIAPNFPRKFVANAQQKSKDILSMVTVALISPMKNYLKVLEALKDVAQNVVYNIYGPVKDADYWNRCLAQINLLPKNITVIYHGDIPPLQVKDVLASNDIYIQPSKSENFGHSIFEALSAGKPVITSHAVPWKNLHASHAGININPENITELSNAIVFFAAMEDEYKEWSFSAATYADNAIDINKIKEQYNLMFYTDEVEPKFV